MLTIMKTKKYILFALAVLGLTTSCMKGDWNAPSDETGMASYGNQDIKATNLKTIAELKALYATEINGNTLAQVTQPMQIQGIVTGNDEGGNIYQTLYIQDHTGAIAISIASGFLYGVLREGQAVLVELNGLYIGGYNNMAEIGSNSYVYDDGTIGLGKMNRFMWQKHCKLISPIEGLTINPLEVKFNLNSLTTADIGKLITLKGVEINAANGVATFIKGNITSLDRELRSKATNQLTSVIRGFKGLSTDQVLMISAYADFANQIIPQGRVDITGVASYYRDTWQILLRTINDIKPTTLADDDVPQGEETIGTLATPKSVSEALELINALSNGGKSKLNAYVKGKVVKVATNETNFKQYGNLNYYISEDGKDKNTIQVYSGDGLNGEKFKSINDIKAGDDVIVFGKLYKYVKNDKVTPEIDKGNYLVSLNGKTK